MGESRAARLSSQRRSRLRGTTNYAGWDWIKRPLATLAGWRSPYDEQMKLVRILLIVIAIAILADILLLVIRPSWLHLR